MKKTILKITMLSIAAISVYNIIICVSPTKEKETVNILLNEIEAISADESGEYGYPLLQSTSGIFKCASCTGTGCSSAC